MKSIEAFIVIKSSLHLIVSKETTFDNDPVLILLQNSKRFLF